MISSDNDEEKESAADWKKMERSMLKVGLKNGLSDGRDKNFQSSFDTGYQDGFQNGFQLGKLKFDRKFHEGSVTSETSDCLDNAKKALCLVCTTENGNENVGDIRQKQAEVIKKAVTNIKHEFSNL